MQPTLATTKPELINWKKISTGGPLPTRRLVLPERLISLYMTHEKKLPDIAEKKIIRFYHWRQKRKNNFEVL